MPDTHVCLNCGKELTKKPTESNNRFAAKKYCSPNCSRMYMKKNKIGWFAPSTQAPKADFNLNEYNDEIHTTETTYN